ncbi:MAG TPA: aldehyde dehydrogenase family protein [Candidatus Omnitrophota bacterium]|nr:aldehyde dehydrogenase family protein [Candidatus Omnitrophota bacterium]HPD84925.1 aldehyde dehydrogenase family protein [Candidatus Omnitrophota bacterium]HRZ03783.1 aldehyde dehydrogenase family protein [Candidatus Omnitrophota bacterium]
MAITQKMISPLFDAVMKTGTDGVWQARNLIDGRWVESSGGYFPVISPVDGQAIARVPKASVAEVKEAIFCAEAAKSSIREIPAIDRITIFNRVLALLEKNEELFRELLLLEAGKPHHEAAGEISAVKERLRMTMQEVKKITGEYIPGDWSNDTSGKIAVVIHEPVGVVAAITSFNYPLYIPAAKIIPALLAGNSMVIKPASAVPLTLLCFVRLLEEAGFPKGVVNIITGSSEVGDAIVSDPRIDMISFTGSTQVGKHIAGIAGLKKLHLELGGKGVAIVLDDADLDLAAKKCVEGSLKNAGQRCDAISAILVVDSIAELLIKKMHGEMERWPLGNPADAKTKVGPVISRQAAQQIKVLIDDAKAKGARLLYGGSVKDCYVEPTLLDQVPLDARIACEETFGPVVTVIRIKDEAEALKTASRPRFGLDSCIFTNNFYRIWKLAKQLQVGGVTVNDLPRHGVGYFPFGGIRDSGIGREGIGYSIEEMTRHKTLIFNLEPAGLGKKPFLKE